MISNPTIAEGPGAVRQLVKNGKALDPEMQKMIAEKNAKANAPVTMGGAPQVAPMKRRTITLHPPIDEGIYVPGIDEAEAPEESVSAPKTSATAAQKLAPARRKLERGASHPAILVEKPEVIGVPDKSHAKSFEHRAADMREKNAAIIKRREAQKLASTQYPGKNVHDGMAAQALAIVNGGEVRLPIPEGVIPDLYQRRILNRLSKRKDTGQWLWSMVRTAPGEFTLRCRGIDAAPAATSAKRGGGGHKRGRYKRREPIMPELPATASPSQEAVEAQPEPEVATAPPEAPGMANVAVPRETKPEPASDCPVLAQECAEFPVEVVKDPEDSDLAEKIQDLTRGYAQVLAREAVAAFWDSPAIARAARDCVLAVESVPQAHTEAPEPPLTPATGQPRGIVDLIAADPPEAAELVERTLVYFGTLALSESVSESEYEDYCEIHAPRLVEAIQRHRRAKAIVESILTPWSIEWDFTGTEAPFADLAVRFHRAIVDVMTEAGKK